MKEKILAVCLISLVLIFVTVNTIVLDNQTEGTLKRIDKLDFEQSEAAKSAEDIYKEFQKKVKYMSLTVSHNDITDIEDRFVEMIGYLSVGDKENAEVARSRLTHSLEHLRRLSGFNIDAII